MGIETVHGNGVSAGIGTLQIGWYDDYGKFHDHLITDGFHMPDSSVNVLGVPAFSEHIGDYEEEGTKITSSSESSVFSWDNGTYKRTFTHPDSSLPEISVNNGFSSFHKLCNFVDKVTPPANKCFKSKKKKFGTRAS